MWFYPRSFLGQPNPNKTLVVELQSPLNKKLQRELPREKLFLNLVSPHCLKHIPHSVDVCSVKSVSKWLIFKRGKERNKKGRKDTIPDFCLHYLGSVCGMRQVSELLCICFSWRVRIMLFDLIAVKTQNHVSPWEVLTGVSLLQKRQSIWLNCILLQHIHLKS